MVGAKLQHVIATLAIESAGISGYGARLKPRDDLFWFKKPELLLSLIHFILFQVSVSRSLKTMRAHYCHSFSSYLSGEFNLVVMIFVSAECF